jgi:hypothetical protein
LIIATLVLLRLLRSLQPLTFAEETLMSFCSDCGFKFSSESRFCERCGSQRTQEGSSVISKKTKNEQSAEVDIDLINTANSIPASFFFSLLLEFKGHDAVENFKNLGGIVAVFLAFSGIIYWLVCVQGLKRNKPEFVLYGALLLSVLFGFGIFTSIPDMSNFNIFDWFYCLLSAAQIVVMLYIFQVLKGRRSI